MRLLGSSWTMLIVSKARNAHTGDINSLAMHARRSAYILSVALLSGSIWAYLRGKVGLTNTCTRGVGHHQLQGVELATGLLNQGRRVAWTVRWCGYDSTTGHPFHPFHSVH